MFGERLHTRCPYSTKPPMSMQVKATVPDPGFSELWIATRTETEVTMLG